MRNSLLLAFPAGAVALPSAAQAESHSFTFIGNPETEPGACANRAALAMTGRAPATDRRPS
jgi:hypothetical protein